MILGALEEDEPPSGAARGTSGVVRHGCAGSADNRTALVGCTERSYRPIRHPSQADVLDRGPAGPSTPWGSHSIPSHRSRHREAHAHHATSTPTTHMAAAANNHATERFRLRQNHHPTTIATPITRATRADRYLRGTCRAIRWRRRDSQWPTDEDGDDEGSQDGENSEWRPVAVPLDRRCPNRHRDRLRFGHPKEVIQRPRPQLCQRPSGLGRENHAYLLVSKVDEHSAENSGSPSRLGRKAA